MLPPQTPSRLESISWTQWTYNNWHTPFTAPYHYATNYLKTSPTATIPPQQPPSLIDRALHKVGYFIGDQIPPNFKIPMWGTVSLAPVLEGMAERSRKTNALSQPTTPIEDPLSPTPSPIKASENPDEISSFFIQCIQALTQNSLVPPSLMTTITSTLAYLMNNIFELIKDKDGFHSQQQQIAQVIEEINASKNTDLSPKQLADLFQKSLNILKDQSLAIYVNGFKLPQFTQETESVENPDRVLLKNLAKLEALDDAHQNNPITSINWRLKADQEKLLCIENTTQFFTMKILCEYICRLPSDDAIYFQLIRNAHHSNTNPKQILFAHLKAQNVNLVQQGIAYTAYFLVFQSINSVMSTLISTFFQELFSYIEENNIDQFQTLNTHLIQRFTAFLTIEIGIYGSIAHEERLEGSINDVLLKRLDEAKSNKGDTSEELYAHLANITIQKCAGNRFFAWLLKQIIGDETMIVHQLVNSSVGSLIDAQGYTHALNCLLVDQLHEIIRNITKTDAQLNPTLFSENKKIELSALVENLFRDLELKKAATTQHKLKTVVDGTSSTQKALELIDSFFIEEVITNLTHNLANLMGALLTAEKLHQFTYQFSNIINQNYNKEIAYTQEDIANKEQELNVLIDRILRLSIENAVKEKFDSSALREQEETNSYIEQLRTLTHNFAEQSLTNLDDLQNLEIFSQESRDQLKRLYTNTINHNIQLANLNSHITRSSLQGFNKTKLFEYGNFAASKMGLYIKGITDLHRKLNHFHQINNKVESINEQILLIGDELRKDENPQFILDQLAKEKAEMSELLNSHEPLPSPFLEGCQALIRDESLIRSQKHIQYLIDVRNFLIEQTEDNSPIFQIVEQQKRWLQQQNDPSIFIRIQSIIASFNPFHQQELHNQIQRLQTRLLSLPSLPPSLQEQLDIITTTRSHASLDQALATYQTICLTHQILTDEKLNGEKELLDITQTATIESINTLKSTHIQEHIQLSFQLGKQIATATEQLKELSIQSQPIPADLLHAKETITAFKTAVKKNKSNTKITNLIKCMKEALMPLLEPRDSFLVTQLTEHDCLPLEQLFSQVPSSHYSMSLAEELSPPGSLEGLIKTTAPILDKILQALETEGLTQSQNTIFKPITYANITLLDTHIIQNTAQQIVFSRVKERVDGLKQFIRCEEVYKYGILHHLFLIPYVNHFRR